MDTTCFLKNCNSTSNDKKLFSIPFEDSALLELWLAKIPKHLYKFIKSSSLICEDHFKKELISSSKDLKQPLVPTIFQDSPRKYSEYLITDPSCRFCLNKFDARETKIEINAAIRQEYFSITQLELNVTNLHSRIICEKCFKSTGEFSAFKTQLIKNQKRIEDLLYLQAPEIEIKDELDESGSFEIQESPNDEEVYEEYLESDATEAQPMEDKLAVKPLPDKRKLCSECGKTFSSYAYKRHYERVHLRLKNYNCDFCNYGTYSRNHIEIHVRSHFKIKTHFCEQCGSSFGSGNILRQHYLTHKDERPYRCELTDCLLAFKSIYALRRHQKTHSENKWRFQCNECSSKFTDKWHLKRHMNGHQSQSHPCNICNKVFGTEDRLKAHQLYHRPPQYQCELCHKEFYKKPDLNAHEKVHTGQKDFQCQFQYKKFQCPNSYFKKAHLNRHMKSHEK